MGKLLLVITDYYMVVALDCISFLSNYIVRLILRSYGYYKVATPLDWNSVVANYNKDHKDRHADNQYGAAK